MFYVYSFGCAASRKIRKAKDISAPLIIYKLFGENFEVGGIF
jgi:hypothetical protein